MKYKVILGLALLLFLIGGACAVEFKDTQGVAEDFNELWIDGKKVANITEFNASDCINTEILAKDNGAFIMQVTKDGASEVSSVDNPDDVYEFLTNNGGMYYTFGKDGKTYIVTIDENQWEADMLTKMDKWCLENSK